MSTPSQALQRTLNGDLAVGDSEFTSYLSFLTFPKIKIGTYAGDAAATKAITG